MNTFVPTNGTGALFAKENFETGEISITGNWTSPEGLDMVLTAVLLEDGSLSISGELSGHPEISCTGLLMPTEYAGGYKAGVISVRGKDRVREYKVNSKGRVDRNNLPYRFIWMASNRVAI